MAVATVSTGADSIHGMRSSGVFRATVVCGTKNKSLYHTRVPKVPMGFMAM